MSFFTFSDFEQEDFTNSFGGKIETFARVVRNMKIVSFRGVVQWKKS